mmetsp:Transcript_25400/g.35400  ORF Transcript_25400/g.35400 Transcript_25400/m.35400 type:complete len:421 (+) Transcript_25400:112-1374(+)|eukprot:CAMPEP_0184487178 /NCGR_PEP_ID=MMETSP0113_2-20130426/9412_1 /TAXON_ID=91329 /ORGANISM="Norrisiella sphaerica, Strain BC52" /LENGTH=420 /DNA_ID=CAMNT_0026869379 /DNA_START=112 /DNA_END=1374 /DNA_ORIENTATION=+
MSESKDTARVYDYVQNLKYGCNPHQKFAAIYTINQDTWKNETNKEVKEASKNASKMPFKVVNGNPGYINLLDALNAWQLVLELKEALSLPAAASFKHVSPAGAAVGMPLDDTLAEVYDVDAKSLTPLAAAYIRARHADPKSSFGDFVALSDKVDEQTAKILKREVSDGIIAPGYDEKALELLKQKKGGKYLILEGDVTYTPPANEYREVYGLVFAQKRNDTVVTKKMFENVVSKNKDYPESAVIDGILATICAKYTQSNSVGFSMGGQMVGVGAGQQSRVDCVKLAGTKLRIWFLRQHPKVRGLKFKKGTKRVERLNARLSFIDENEMTGPERKAWLQYFEETPESLTEKEKSDFLSKLEGVTLASDAFFPFRDNIDVAAKFGVKYIAQPGGSTRDAGVTSAADEYNMVMVHHGIRVFHH